MTDVCFYNVVVVVVCVRLGLSWVWFSVILCKLIVVVNSSEVE